MHEASLVQGLLKLIDKALREEKAANPAHEKIRVTEIICSAGLLACFEAQTLAACLEIFAEGTCCEGARLTVETEPLHCHCEACQKDFTISQRNFVCPQCGGEKIKFQGGNGLMLKALNIDCEDCDNG